MARSSPMVARKASVLGYGLSAQVDSKTMFGDLIISESQGTAGLLYQTASTSHDILCGHCGRKKDPAWINPTYRVGRRRRDAVATYDGYFLVSRRFKEAWERTGHIGAVFDSLPADPGYFSLRSTQILEFDVKARETRFEDYCDSCGAYAAVIGAYPIFLKGVSQPLAPGFFRTDVEFATGIAQSPILIVAPESFSSLKSSSLVGLEFSPIKA